jgi:hypothetical protein
MIIVAILKHFQFQLYFFNLQEIYHNFFYKKQQPLCHHVHQIHRTVLFNLNLKNWYQQDVNLPYLSAILTYWLWHISNINFILLLVLFLLLVHLNILNLLPFFSFFLMCFILILFFCRFRSVFYYNINNNII